MQIRYSELVAKNKRTQEDLERINAKNDQLLKDNAELDESNTKIDAQIEGLKQRVDVNSLLKEVDMQELELLAQNTDNMNQNFIRMLSNWNQISTRIVQ